MNPRLLQVRLIRTGKRTNSKTVYAFNNMAMDDGLNESSKNLDGQNIAGNDQTQIAMR